MKISEKVRTTLDDPTITASESRTAYNPDPRQQGLPDAGEAWAKKHGFDFTAIRDSTTDSRQSPN